MDDPVIGRETEDEVAALGSPQVALARALEHRLEESRRLLQIAEQVEGGLHGGIASLGSVQREEDAHAHGQRRPGLEADAVRPQPGPQAASGP